MGDAEHRLLLRRPARAHTFGEARLNAGDTRRPGLDAALVPALLLLVARDLLLHDPLRALAWRFLHDPRLAAVPGWLAWVVPRPSPALDRDPLALLLGATAVGCALAYLTASLLRASSAAGMRIVALAAAALVVAPTAGFVAMGAATQRPYGQDGGVVQVPLALEKLLAGESPYGADYSDSILGKEARRSDFWTAYGANPILRHHAYLPGTHLLMLPAYLAMRGSGWFDARLVTLAAFVLAAALAAALVDGGPLRAAAAALVLLNPLVYWHQIFGANDVIVVALLLGAVWLARAERPVAAGALLGFACATKQLAWPFAPFLLAWFSGARTIPDLLRPAGLRRLAGPAASALAVFLAIVAPVAALDLRRFWGDVFVYNAGLPGGDNYPFGGTPGFGFANVLIYFGRVASLGDYVPLGWSYLLLIPLGVLLLRRQLREASLASVLTLGSAALLASLYVSRVVHPNYLVLPAILLPLGFLMGERRPADVVLVPLLLLATAVEFAEQAVFRTSWEDALSVRLPQHLTGLGALLAPRASPAVTQDPLGLIASATAAGLAVVYLLCGLLGTGRRGRLALLLVAVLTTAALPTWCLVRIGGVTGTPRAEDPWFAGASRLQAREAWSSSFRRDPPALLEPVSPRAPSTGDPRWLALVALGATAVLLLRLTAVDLAPATLAILVSPAAVIATVFGGGDVVLLALVLLATALAARGAPRGSAAAWLFGGLCFPRALLAAGVRGGAKRLLLATALFAAMLVAFVPDPAAPGVGLSNVLAYFGAGETCARLVSWGAALVVLGGLWLLRARLEGEPLQVAAASLLAGLFLLPGASPNDFVVPLGLLALAAAGGASLPEVQHPAARAARAFLDAHT